MSAWPELAFGDLVADVTGGNIKTLQSDYLSSGEFPIIDQGQSLIGGYTNDAERVCKADLPVIIFGDHTKCFKFVDFPFCLGADGTKILRPKKSIDERYLFYALQRIHIPDAGYSRHFKYLKEGRIPLPPLDEQKRIAVILDQADELRRKRQRAIDRLSQLRQAIFHEMFGDPAINSMGWPTMPLGDMAEKFSDGPFGSNLKSEHYVEQGVRVIRLQNIGIGEFIDKDRAYISHEHFRSISKHACAPGDVLVGTLGDPNLRACLLPAHLGPALNKADCVQIRPNRSVASNFFICGLLNHPSTERKAHDLILGQTRARISMGRLKSLRVPCPPIALQQAFGLRISKLEELRALYAEALASIEVLFASLQLRAFRGELQEAI
jgi:type I restriction enzyme S subunit